MLLYNVTVKIDKDIEEEWLQWIKEKHIPDMMRTGQFTEARLCHLLDQPEDEESTYVIQYHCENNEKFNRYVNAFSSTIRDEHAKRYKEKFVAFRTLMEIIEIIK
ncbi:MAG: DUF4286 family protein [Chitinophagales bacterium]|nr:DUF4286 family protein [Chitinophagales bacterium]